MPITLPDGGELICPVCQIPIFTEHILVYCSQMLFAFDNVQEKFIHYAKQVEHIFHFAIDLEFRKKEQAINSVMSILKAPHIIFFNVCFSEYANPDIYESLIIGLDLSIEKKW
jgi:hypothetical protein